jgi:heat shock protein 5
VQVLNEPTAAAIAYGLDRKIKAKRVLVFDLGGGTFDVSLLTIDKGDFRVMATSGDTHLGGADFDQRIMDWFVSRFKMKHEKDLTTSKRALAKLRREAEMAKRVLSAEKKVVIEIPAIMVRCGAREPTTSSFQSNVLHALPKGNHHPISPRIKDRVLCVRACVRACVRPCVRPCVKSLPMVPLHVCAWRVRAGRACTP